MEMGDLQYPTANKEYPMTKGREYDRQDRLVDYAVRIIKLSEALPETKARKHVSTLRVSRRPGRARRGSASDLGNWIFLVGCWILKTGEKDTVAVSA